jgi:hypothetical protein
VELRVGGWVWVWVEGSQKLSRKGKRREEVKREFCKHNSGEMRIEEK